VWASLSDAARAGTAVLTLGLLATLLPGCSTTGKPAAAAVPVTVAQVVVLPQSLSLGGRRRGAAEAVSGQSAGGRGHHKVRFQKARKSGQARPCSRSTVSGRLDATEAQLARDSPN
jgi:hypothetical protein